MPALQGPASHPDFAATVVAMRPRISSTQGRAEKVGDALVWKSNRKLHTQLGEWMGPQILCKIRQRALIQMVQPTRKLACSSFTSPNAKRSAPSSRGNQAVDRERIPPTSTEAADATPSQDPAPSHTFLSCPRPKGAAYANAASLFDSPPSANGARRTPMQRASVS